MKLTFLAARELRSLPTDICLEAVWQTADELQNVRISTSFFDLFLRNLFSRLGSAEKNIELDGPIV